MATGGIATAQKQHPAERMREELEDGELEEGMNGQEPPMEVSDDKVAFVCCAHACVRWSMTNTLVQKEPAPPLNHAPPSATSYSVQSPASIPVPTATVNDGIQYCSQNRVSYGTTSSLLLIANDDVLKNLMMSWYWAGYYTGLYEGQQRATMATQ